MMLRRLGAAAAALGATLLIASSALAGGMAIANLDATPGQPRVGEPLTIGFTALQHGVRPWTEGSVSVTARNQGTGESITADARAEGKPGHYVATLTFPSAGTWTWEIQMPLFMSSKFAPLTVLPAAAAPATQPTPSPAGVPGTAILGVGALAALIAASAYLFVRRRPTPAVG
jgi:hypothetical protein